MSTVIEIENLSRTFETTIKPEGLYNSIKALWSRQYKQKIALQNLNLKIESGQIIGLVGANGAGKTTLLKLLSGLIYPTSGRVSVLGYEPSRRSFDFLRQMSILLGQKNQLWWDIPAMDSYSLLATIYDVEFAVAHKRIMDLAHELQCVEQLNIPLRKLSLGERMKMEIIGSILHSPKILFLDEPTLGLDVMAQTSIRNFLHNYVAREKPTIILTSHYMDDITKLAQRLLVVSHGELVYDGTVDHFMSRARLTQKLSCGLEKPVLERTPLIEQWALEPEQTYFEAQLPSEKVGDVLSRILQLTPIHDLKIEETDFEDAVREFMQSH